MTIATLFLALLITPGAEGKSHKTPVLLDFHADWCGPCKQVRPEVERLVGKGYPVRSIDIDQSRDLADRYKVTAIPAFIVVDSQGRALARCEGYRSAAQLADFYNTTATQSAKPRDDVPIPAAEEEDSREAAREQVVEPRTDSGGRKNPEPWKTVARIRVLSRASTGFGSGTVIYSDEDVSLILTCAHIFHVDGVRKQPHPSQFPSRLEIDLFDGKLQSNQSVRPIQTVKGEAIDYDYGNDVGLIRIRPGKKLPASPVVPASWRPAKGLPMTTVGCSEGRPATAWSTQITNPLVRGLNTNPNYEAIECAHAPREGRSGGGLYTLDGYVAGVCDFADRRYNHGLYAAPKAIHHLLDKNQLTALYSPGSSGSKTLLANNRPANRAPREYARLQNDDRPEPKLITVPRHEMMGIPVPGVASKDVRRKAEVKRDEWSSVAPVRTEAAKEDEADEAIAAFPDRKPNGPANSNRASTVDDAPVQETSSESDEPERAAPSRSRDRKAGNWETDSASEARSK